ncbi:type VII secretion-associated serine protease mycosin, partial [Streptomyces sp. SID2563]|nr:type VII secretion-associated serine protease mycosin [Streptomyces sp. SID2563]
RYFGAGPTPEPEDDGPAGWLAPAAGGLGVLLLAAGVLLWRGRSPFTRNR